MPDQAEEPARPDEAADPLLAEAADTESDGPEFHEAPPAEDEYVPV
jgi:hypothetical protein